MYFLNPAQDSSWLLTLRVHVLCRCWDILTRCLTSGGHFPPFRPVLLGVSTPPPQGGIRSGPGSIPGVPRGLMSQLVFLLCRLSRGFSSPVPCCAKASAAPGNVCSRSQLFPNRKAGLHPGRAPKCGRGKASPLGPPAQSHPAGALCQAPCSVTSAWVLDILRCHFWRQQALQHLGVASPGAW